MKNINKILVVAALIGLLSGCNKKSNNHGGGEGSSSTSQPLSSEQIWNNFIAGKDNFVFTGQYKSTSTFESFSATGEGTTNLVQSFQNEKIEERVGGVDTLKVPENKILDFLSNHYHMEVTQEDLSDALAYYCSDGTTYEIAEGFYNFTTISPEASSFYDFKTNDDVILDYYNYNFQEEKYVKHSSFKNWESYQSVYLYNQMKFASENGNRFIYDETNNCFSYDLTKTNEDLLNELFGELTSFKYIVQDEAVCSLELAATQTLGIEVSTIELNGTFTFGNASVEMPTGLILCPHDDTDTDNCIYNDEYYHYEKCEDCDSVISASKCTFDEEDKCTVCGDRPANKYFVVGDSDNEVVYVRATGIHHFILSVGSSYQYSCHDTIFNNNSYLTINIEEYPQDGQYTFQSCTFITYKSVNYALLQYKKENTYKYILIRNCSFTFNDENKLSAVIGGGTFEVFKSGEVLEDYANYIYEED